MPQDCQSILLTWSDPDVAVVIDRSTDTRSWMSVLSPSRAGQVAFLDTNLQPSTAYYYRVTPLCGP